MKRVAFLVLAFSLCAPTPALARHATACDDATPCGCCHGPDDPSPYCPDFCKEAGAAGAGGASGADSGAGSGGASGTAAGGTGGAAGFGGGVSGSGGSGGYGGVAGGASGSGSGGSAGASDAGVSSSAVTSDDGGCSCRAVGTDPSSADYVLSAGLVGLAMRGKRRRTRAERRNCIPAGGAPHRAVASSRSSCKDCVLSPPQPDRSPFWRRPETLPCANTCRAAFPLPGSPRSEPCKFRSRSLRD
jgi:hypothetical protein